MASVRRSKRQSGRPATPPQELVQHCAICLEEPKALAWLDACSHRFCFACIREWSGQSNTCPLCKSVFHRISSRARKVAVATPSESEESAEFDDERAQSHWESDSEWEPSSERSSSEEEASLESSSDYSTEEASTSWTETDSSSDVQRALEANYSE